MRDMLIFSWKYRRSPDVPIPVRSGIADIDVKRTCFTTIVTVATDKSDTGRIHNPFNLLFIIFGEMFIPEPLSLRGYIYRRSPEVPSPVRSGIADTDVKRTRSTTTATVATDKSDTGT